MTLEAEARRLEADSEAVENTTVSEALVRRILFSFRLFLHRQKAETASILRSAIICNYLKVGGSAFQCKL